MIPFRETGGAWTPDFSLMNRYLDAYARHVRTPEFVTLYVWDPDARLSGRRRPPAPSVILTRIVAGEPEEWAVPILDPAAGRPLEVLLDGFRSEILKRGWTDAQILIGMANDRFPSEAVAARFRELAPWAKWLRFSHWRDGQPRPATEDTTYTLRGYLEIGLMEQETPPGRALGGWDMRFPRVTILRRHITEYCPLTQFRNAIDVAVGGLPPEPYPQSASNGLCRWGLDYWNIDGGGPLLLKYDRNQWGLMYRPVSVKKLLGQGADGPVATTRLEMLLEGLQETEARIALEKAIRRDDLAAPLRQECEALLKDRLHFRNRGGRTNLGADYMGEQRENEIYTRLWSVAPDWQAQALRLFNLAARVAE
jgi:hypothetical protein